MTVVDWEPACSEIAAVWNLESRLAMLELRLACLDAFYCVVCRWSTCVPLADRFQSTQTRVLLSSLLSVLGFLSDPLHCRLLPRRGLNWLPQSLKLSENASITRHSAWNQLHIKSTPCLQKGTLLIFWITLSKLTDFNDFWCVKCW